MKAFITGSRAYGYPKDDSDVDLAILCSNVDLEILWTEAYREHGKRDGSPKLMFGHLNLVAFDADDPEEVKRFERWREAHNKLVAMAPVTKDVAIKMFRQHDAEGRYNHNCSVTG